MKSFDRAAIDAPFFPLPLQKSVKKDLLPAASPKVRFSLVADTSRLASFMVSWPGGCWPE
jgi:hypothetical protein